MRSLMDFDLIPDDAQVEHPRPGTLKLDIDLRLVVEEDPDTFEERWCVQEPNELQQNHSPDAQALNPKARARKCEVDLAIRVPLETGLEHQILQSPCGGYLALLVYVDSPELKGPLPKMALLCVEG
eukprot:CAMPEP_0115570404 /NCGR_PEP_ID=MMETSP0271-20121206/105687_1 /TAXON_ID=71861 /ORGANISM="Scrippsiella trochoidea, Strain CCMP3099" /LENGTH=125 /DNA_ID=CAMNT_0003004951 /DNA_START=1105 /DNA_END=1482 /DNA_ORIENTATION=-